MKLYIKTFGCTANRADSAWMKQVLEAHGHTFLDSHDSADLVIVNTCTVTETTQRKVLKFIRYISESGKQIVVAGCLPAAQPGTLAQIEHRSVTPSSLADIAGIVGAGYNTGKSIEAPGPEGVTGIVGISRGCIGDCSYCIVKQARGELVSRTVPEIAGEVRSLVQHGAKEIQLTSQDSSAYGMDTGDRLPGLLGALSGFDGDYMVRVGMMNPFTILEILDDVIDSFRDPHIFKFLHLPVQSGSDRVLAHMNRRHTVGDFKYIVHEFRMKFPDITLSTDFIVGYPTETEQDFNETLELLDEIRPVKVNITKYSPRPNTPASLLYDMPDWKKKERSRILTRAHHRINRELFQKKIGDNILTLTTETGSNNSTIGRDIYYNNIVVKEKLPLGHRYNLKITGSRITYLIGELTGTSPQTPGYFQNL